MVKEDVVRFCERRTRSLRSPTRNRIERTEQLWRRAAG